ncbi:hypothetical protein HGB47_14885 [Leptospira yasudae]|uniref:hypothetical protein n=1 Tax=Leptospira yasudae TaxID=2202201 RepID=UPI001C4E6AD1|nr:hypothetical protein [Leptospira yasudae]MBW0434902.1 hypothetical protein [Leptospira yasudae]
MTAIISYFDKEKRIVIVGCDSMCYSSHGKNIPCDKGYILFNRYFIATYGADLLSGIIEILKNREGYGNFQPPANLKELYEAIFQIYKIAVPAYRERASEEFKERKKQVAAIIYDEATNQFDYISYGHPFMKEIELSYTFRDNDEGIQKFGILETDDPCEDIDIQNFLERPKEVLNDQFIQLDDHLEMITEKNLPKERIKVGELGTYYEYRNGNRILESRFTHIDQMIPIIEY